jgi:hypothetical protein
MTAKTTLWFVYLVSGPDGLFVRVSATEQPRPYHRVMRIRTITARAAGRKYIRDNYATDVHLWDDGGNEPGDLVDPNPHNNYNPRAEKRQAKRRGKRWGAGGRTSVPIEIVR